MKTFLCLLLVFLMLSFPRQTKETSPAVNLPNRGANLHTFFERYKCPKPFYIDEYLNAADRYQIDYRLLAAISIQESTCGKHYRLNNYWGWNSARTGFESVPSGIDFVARQLSENRHYKNKPIEGKLHSYNPEPSYAGKIKRLMKEIEQ